MLIEQIRTDLTTATKAKDVDRQRTLRSVIAAVQEAEVSGDAATTLDDDGVQAVVKAQVKRRIDAAEAFEAGGADDRAGAERAEIAILETYLPAALTTDELDAIVASVFDEHGFSSGYPNCRHKLGNLRAAGQRPVSEEILADHVVDFLCQTRGMAVGNGADIAHRLNGHLVEQPEPELWGQHPRSPRMGCGKKGMIPESCADYLV